MLKALYDYAIGHKLTLPAGYIKKTVKAYISLGADGQFLGIQMGTDEAVAAPDIGSLANGKDKSNVLVEKRSVVIPEEASLKSAFFLNALKDGGKAEPRLSLCACALEDSETAARIREKLDQNKVKASDRISFMVDGVSVLEGEAVLNWWLSFRQQFQKTDGKSKTVCLITGEPTIPATTTTPVNGLHSVGGHARGDALICFDKNAFCSYDLKKAENAPVSEESFAAVKAGLDDLLSKSPKPIAGMKFVHWYDRDIPQEEDPLQDDDLFGFEDPYADDEPEELTELTPEEQQRKEREARKQADKLIESVQGSQKEYYLDDVSYYILLLSGVGGRVMIRRYERGNYQELRERLDQWKRDIALTNSYGTAEMKSCKLSARLMSLMSYQKVDNRPFERQAKEMAGLTPTILSAILSGGVLPDTVAARALAHIRSLMLSNEENNDYLEWEIGLACQWLKVWLIRTRNKGDVLMKEYNPEYHSNAYYSGAMMSVYEAIQQAAMPDVNASIMQRFYASAVQTPALVLGRLSSMSVHHLEKMENEWLMKHLKDYLDETAAKINGRIPATLNLEQQSDFALGYYQMCAKLTKEKLERIAAKKVKEENKED